MSTQGVTLSMWWVLEQEHQPYLGAWHVQHLSTSFKEALTLRVMQSIGLAREWPWPWAPPETLTWGVSLNLPLSRTGHTASETLVEEDAQMMYMHIKFKKNCPKGFVNHVCLWKSSWEQWLLFTGIRQK